MKKLLLSTMAATAFAMPMMATANEEPLNDVGLAINYGLFSGPTLELSYPINEELNVRGALSGGMSGSTTSTGAGTEPDFSVSLGGGIHRLALDYRPFAGSFFLSGGYAINSYKLEATASQVATDTVTIGDTTYTATSVLSLNGELKWNNAPTLSLGWGHSPSKGWGGLFEIGAIFTGAPDVSLTGSGFVDDGVNPPLDVSSDPTVRAELDKQAATIKNDVGNFDFMPIFQAGITYRF